MFRSKVIFAILYYQASTPAGDTALHLAARRRDVDMARILVDYGAAIDATNASGMTALHISAAEGDEPLVKYFYGVRANAAIADNEGKAIHNKHAMKDVGVPNIYLHKEITSIEVTIFA